MEDCQLVLDNPQDPVAETMPMAMSKEVMESVLTKQKNIGDDIPRDSVILSDLKRLCAYAIYNVLNGIDNEGKTVESFSSLIYQHILTLHLFQMTFEFHS